MSKEKRWQNWLNLLSPFAKKALLDDSRKYNTSELKTSSGFFWAIEIFDGQYPLVRRFNSISSLAKHIGSLEGQDVVVVPFVGDLFLFSKGPKRILFSSGGVAVSCYSGKTVSVPLESATIQSDFFLGPLELSVGAPLLPEEEIADRIEFIKLEKRKNNLLPTMDDEEDGDVDDDSDDDDDDTTGSYD